MERCEIYFVEIVRGREGVVMGLGGEVCADGVLVGVGDMGCVVVNVGDAVVCIASLPDV